VGPTSLDDVQPFLYNLFRDPDIFKIPIFQKQIAKLISTFRAPKAAEQYKQIGTNSPINKWTKVQAELLQKKLAINHPNIDVIIGMRYWHPMIKDIAAKDYSGYKQVILLPLYPQYSVVTTGSSINEWKRYYKGEIEAAIVREYHDHSIYIDSVNQRIDEALDEHDIASSETTFLFSAHGIPESFIRKGDPYQEQIQKSVSEIMKKRATKNPFHICYQSKVGPVKWLSPSTKATILKLANERIKKMVIVPISFVSDHLETLSELSIMYKKVAEDAGVSDFVVTKGLNDSPLFIAALADIVENQIKSDLHG